MFDRAPDPCFVCEKGFYAPPVSGFLPVFSPVGLIPAIQAENVLVAIALLLDIMRTNQQKATCMVLHWSIVPSVQ